ncbi:MAG: 3-dehydroquinate synthase [Clostridia bacterium]|nr:3-dehydroquinate synthase [Clostridia bacterium]
MKTIKVNASVSYDVVIGEGLLAQSGNYCKAALGKACRLCVVTDDNVAPLYLDTVTASLEAAGFDVFYYVFPNGEASKSAENLIDLLEVLAENRLTRSDALVALGGGVIGDLTGFAAAVYLRGIRFIQMPTTLLAAVDSSVGGKTAVDLSAGKNLAGAFHQPTLVLCDYTTLGTLTPEVFSDGCAEVIKYGVINDRPFFELLKSGVRSQIEEVIAVCVNNKAKIVEEDEFDKGTRQLLNLGHTVGHAIEICSNLTVSHGSAVAMGMVIVTRLAHRLGLCPAEELEELIALLKQEGLPTDCPYSAEELCEIATADKKRSGDTLTLIIPYGIGNSRLYAVPVDQLPSYIQKGLSA